MTTPKEAAAAADHVQAALTELLELKRSTGYPELWMQAKLAIYHLEEALALRATPAAGCEHGELGRRVCEAAERVRDWRGHMSADDRDLMTPQHLALYDAVDALRAARQPEPLEELRRLVEGAFPSATPLACHETVPVGATFIYKLRGLIGLASDAALAQKGGSK